MCQMSAAVLMWKNPSSHSPTSVCAFGLAVVKGMLLQGNAHC